MIDIDRYGPTCDCMSKMRWGDWVKASDYDQLKAENDRLEGGWNERDSRVANLERENDTIRKQLDEARELLRKTAMHVRPTCSDLYDELNAWLEANKQRP